MQIINVDRTMIRYWIIISFWYFVNNHVVYLEYRPNLNLTTVYHYGKTTGIHDI